jgi:hypothetical protein
MDETRLAEEIVQVLPEGAIRLCSADRDTIRYAVRSRELKLRTVVLGRQALRRLLFAADGVVKIEYLQRDLLRSAATRAEFAYPRPRVAPRTAGAAATARVATAAC